MPVLAGAVTAASRRRKMVGMSLLHGTGGLVRLEGRQTMMPRAVIRKAVKKKQAAKMTKVMMRKHAMLLSGGKNVSSAESCWCAPLIRPWQPVTPTC